MKIGIDTSVFECMRAAEEAWETVEGDIGQWATIQAVFAKHDIDVDDKDIRLVVMDYFTTIQVNVDEALARINRELAGGGE